MVFKSLKFTSPIDINSLQKSWPFVDKATQVSDTSNNDWWLCGSYDFSSRVKTVRGKLFAVCTTWISDTCVALSKKVLRLMASSFGNKPTSKFWRFLMVLNDSKTAVLFRSRMPCSNITNRTVIFKLHRKFVTAESLKFTNHIYELLNEGWF